MDTGIGFRKSLSERFSFKNDFDAIEKALFHVASRYPEKGRGHGLAAVRRFVNQWDDGMVDFPSAQEQQDYH